MLIGYSKELDGYGDCTGRWRWSCWTALFRWFGLLRLEVEYVMDHQTGITTYRKATTDEWKQIVATDVLRNI